MNEESIKKLLDNQNFKEFQANVYKKFLELDSVEGLEDMSNEEAGEEAKVRYKAIKLLEEIMTPFIDFTEKKEPSEDQILKRKAQFGL